MPYRVTERTTRDDGLPRAELYGPDGRHLRVVGPDAHGLAVGRLVDVVFTDVGDAAAPTPQTPTIPLVQVALGGAVSNP